MKAEDDVFDYMKMLERMAAFKAAAEKRMKWEADMAKKDPRQSTIPLVSDMWIE